MSRWGKNRAVPSYALPLDALVKEKENTNRPVAARSAGTVGKWGVTSFTSMRARPIYGFASFSPNQDPSLQYSQFSPKSIDTGISNTVQAPINTSSATKPKKFFKSRNSVSDDAATAFTDSQVAANVASYYSSPTNQHQTVDYPEKTRRKKAAKSVDQPKKPKEKPTKAEKPPKAEKPAKVEKAPKPVKVEKSPKKAKVAAKAKVTAKVPDVPKPTRVLSRTRKVVNYSEDQSRSPLRNTHINLPVETDAQTNANVYNTQSPDTEIANNNINSTEPNLPQSFQPYHDDQCPDDSPSKNSLNSCPPIVLRISKGISRLISTDSEGISGSPPYLSPTQQPILNTQQYQANVNYPNAASLVADLTEDPIIPQETHDYANESPFDQNLNAAAGKTKKEKTGLKAEPIKLKIKTNARLRNNIDLLEDNEGTENRPRSTRRTTPQHTVSGSFEDNVPAPGTANYELYRTLTESPNHKPVDEGQSHFGSTSESNHYPVADYQHLNYLPEVDAQNANSDTERGILPKKRRGRNKAKFDPKFEAVPEPVTEKPPQKKQRGRKKQDDQSDVIESPDFNVFANSQIEQAQIEDHTSISTEKRITAAAKKQYKDEYLSNPIPSPAHIETIQQEVETEFVNRRGRKGKAKLNQNTTSEERMLQPEASQRATRATRNNANGNMAKSDQVEVAPPTRSYGRKRKAPPEDPPDVANVYTNVQSSDHLTLPPAEQTGHDAITMLSPLDDEANDEQKKGRNKIKRQNQNSYNGSHEQPTSNNNDISSPFEVEADKAEDNFEKLGVKLVISKKKGSIFKSRAIETDSAKQKRHVYKHKWDDDSEEKGSAHDETKNNAPGNILESDFDMDDDQVPVGTVSGSNSNTISKFARTARSNVPDDDLRIRNVKKAHQMQEIGEFQEMDDDVEYILESLKSQNPIATRSLAAIQLAFKCMTPAFRMHVRAHGTATKFFSALHDATQNQSLGLCTASIMFVLIQDNLNMDLDKHSLELMLNLLDSDISRQNNYKETGLTDEQSQRNEQKVIEICREIKSQGKAEHLNLDNISIGTLAMETLLTLTSKRDGEWFKDEVRNLGGLEHIINTICECCKQISDYVVEWTETLLEKLRKIERCLRVLENVSERNEENQKYILHYRDGEAIQALVKFYKLCDSEISLHPTSDKSAAGEPGVVLREALVPTLKVLINLTHTFNNKPLGSVLFGKNPIIFDTCLHLLLQATDTIPEKCVFELSLLVLLLLINLVTYSDQNRKILMEATAPTDYNTHNTVPAIKALIEYFYKYEEMPRLVEENTDDILNNPDKCDKNKYKSQEDFQENTVSKLLQEAGNHMEHTFLASYVGLLIGNLIMECKEYQIEVRKNLRKQSFIDMVPILDKYYNFLNLTASSEAIQVTHMKETKRIIQFMKDCDSQANRDEKHTDRELSLERQIQSLHSAAAPRTKTYSSASSENRLASNSNADIGGTSNSLFNKLCFDR